ncbi:hypothetical protein LRR81_13455 [Metabacillus sp. GX 13764]|uniref:hypothetical protein n=1 Tax=Metabacillus kandeliae TaxID=2900151 RepID=UPI001E441C34|nr:hypothetical protein [Metabacillus kandeliae]MCD7035248.1 hypothetical protein [Metabacillus kandeliae]
MGKKMAVIFVTLLILSAAAYAVSYFTGTRFIDYAFLVGIMGSALIWFFSSKGGFSSSFTDMAVQSSTGFKMEKQQVEFTPNFAFFTAVAFTIGTFAAGFF